MNTIVGIFDNARDLDKAIDRLSRAGFQHTVYDEAIVGEEPGGGAAAVFAPGYGPPAAWGSSVEAEWGTSDQPARHSVVKAFRAHLADFDVPAEVIEAYAVTFNHHGEFILVRTNADRAEQATDILRRCGASRVNCHD